MPCPDDGIESVDWFRLNPGTARRVLVFDSARIAESAPCASLGEIGATRDPVPSPIKGRPARESTRRVRCPTKHFGLSHAFSKSTTEAMEVRNPKIQAGRCTRPQFDWHAYGINVSGVTENTLPHLSQDVGGQRKDCQFVFLVVGNFFEVQCVIRRSVNILGGRPIQLAGEFTIDIACWK